MREQEGERIREGESNKTCWTVVRSKRRRAGGPKHLRTGYYGVPHCYVNNLPQDIKEIEIVKLFERWGKISDIYIARKRNRLGIFFPFVRSEGVKDEERIESKMKEIWFGSYKLWVNTSKF